MKPFDDLSKRCPEKHVFQIFKATIEIRIFALL
jgi:hypothetical protein